MVRLDDTLRSIIAQGVNDEVPEVVKWEEIMNRVLYKMSRTFKITTNANAIFTQKEQKGKLPHIDIRVANKAGNKKVRFVPYCSILLEVHLANRFLKILGDSNQ